VGGGGEEGGWGGFGAATGTKHRDKLFFEQSDFSISIFFLMLHTHPFIYQPRHIILANDAIFKQHT